MEMRIDTRLIAVMLAVVTLAVCAVCVTDGSDAASEKTVSVYAEVDGRVVEMTGTGNDLPSAIEDAVDGAGYEVNLGPANIISFNGQDAPSGKYWTVQQWLPPRGWQVVTFNDASANFVDGTSYFLFLAERTTVDGYSTYTSPDYEPEAKAYFYIQFKDDVNANSYVTSVLTEEQRSEGFWISGTGSNAAWAFKDACERLGFELNMSDGVKGGIVDYDYIGWLNSFLGLEDELLSGSTMDGSWKYWSQFYWDDSTGSWVYGETMGHYDPGVTQYCALIRQITTKEQMLDEMCATLGGRAAEDLFLGRISTGAMNDLERVTKQAYGMIVYLGMSDKLPNLCYYSNDEYSFNRPYSEKTAELIDEEVKKMVNEQYERAKKILSEHREGHGQLAQLLIEKEVIFAEDVENIFGPRPWTSRSEEIMSAKRISDELKKAEEEEDRKVNGGKEGQTDTGAGDGNEANLLPDKPQKDEPEEDKPIDPSQKGVS